MIEESEIQKAIYEGEIKICGLTLRTAVLDNGTRVINADDLEKFWLSLGDGSIQLTEENSLELAKFIQGKT